MVKAHARKLKPLAEQVIVITGATSGIGLTTARMAAARGAKLVLAARNGAALDRLAEELRQSGAKALAVPVDVGVAKQVAALGNAAVAHFGRIDTWVNNAGISVYGRLEDVPLEDQERLFRTNFWGVVHGATVAQKLMRHGGGVIINLGSELSDRAAPLQGMYSASKQAVKGFTDALRIEIEHDRLPLSVTLIRPSGIDTMLTTHARNYMAHEPELPPPLYAPEVVAEAILYSAQHRQRDVFVGAAARLVSLSANHVPRVFDQLMRLFVFRQQKAQARSRPGRKDALYRPDGIELRQRQGGHRSRVHETSLYTFLATRGKPLAAPLIVGTVLLGALLRHAMKTRAVAQPGR
jgi:short-subunit dehydrogenase